jgi:hypothetical protein
MSGYVYVILAIGVFVGNWLVVPLLFKNKTHTYGFFVGLIAAVLILGFGFVVRAIR